MSIDVLAFAFGGILLLVGILGGGFELKELKVPRVGGAIRLVTLLAGSCFITLAIGLHSSVKAPASPTNIPVVSADVGKPTPPTPAREDPVEFTIHDQLGENEVSEKVIILLDGRRVGTLTVSEEYPDAMISVSVPQAGRYSYTAEATLAFDIDGERHQVVGAGQGTINAKPGKSFDLRGSFNSNNTLLISLEERPQ